MASPSHPKVSTFVRRLSMLNPDIDAHQPLPDGRTWTAIHESINPRHDDAYYLIEFWDNGQHAGCIMVVVYARLSPEQRHDQLHALAVNGASNTAYKGSMLWRRRRKEHGLPLP